MKPACYSPKPHPTHAYIKFWGTRGSCPVSGSEYVRFGGNTACLEVTDGEHLVIIDAGSGIRPLGEKLVHTKVKKIDLFLGHAHWDHIIGIPFFKPFYKKGMEIRIWTPEGLETSTKEIFSEMLTHTYFPVGLDQMGAKLVFKTLKANQKVKAGAIQVEAMNANHPGATFCFKIKVANQTFGYATDNEVLKGYLGNPCLLTKKDTLFQAHAEMVAFFKGCDFLIHEAQYTCEEYQHRIGWGHSSIANAAFLVKHAGISDWIVTHHDPQHDDATLERKAQLHQDILDDLSIDCHIYMAYDGQVILL